MAWAIAPALQLAQLGGLQHVRGLHLPQPALTVILFYSALKSRALHTQTCDCWPASVAGVVMLWITRVTIVASWQRESLSVCCVKSPAFSLKQSLSVILKDFFAARLTFSADICDRWRNNRARSTVTTSLSEVGFVIVILLLLSFLKRWGQNKNV